MSKTRVSVDVAARLLGISPDGVRKRVRRGALDHERDGGRVWVLLDADPAASNTVQDEAKTVSDGPAPVDAALVDHLTAEVAYLRSELTRARALLDEERRRHDTIVAQYLSRPAELAPVEDVPRAATPPDTPRRPWWRFW